MNNKQRIAVGLITASASFYGGLKGYEGYTSKPIIPTKGDVPTIGHGTTVYPNGQRVTLQDKAIDRKTADHYLRSHVSKTEAQFKKSIPNVKLTQNEYDAYMDFIYNFGIGNFSKSIRTNLINGNHAQACNAMLKYKFSAGRDCSIRSNGCYGVWIRQQERVKKCLSS